MTSQNLLAGASALALLPFSAAAQDVFVLDEIIVSAAFEAASAQSTGVSASVVTAEELEASAETRVIDVLDRLPGVGILTRGPIGTLSSITVRGASRNYVQVLVDGIDVTDPSGPQVAYDFGQLTTAGIDRIELLRGAQSAQYGSQAIGGVISITTARAEEDGVEQSVSLEAGSYETIRGSYSLAARSGDSDIAVTLSRVQTDGYSAADEDDGNTEADGYSATRLSFSGGTGLQSGTRLEFSGFYERGEGEYDEQFPISDGNAALDEENEFTTYGLRGALLFSSESIDHEVALTGFYIDRTDSGSTAFGPSEFNYEGRRAGLSYQGTRAMGENRLTFGASVTRELYEETSTFSASDGANTVAAIYGEYGWAVSPQFDLTTTLRADTHSEFGEFVTGRIQGAYRANAQTTIRGAIATGYRAPSPYELFGPFGDDTLQPEESFSVDLGVERRFGAQSAVRATLFYNETTDLIDFVGSGYTQIAGTTIRQGLELEATTQVSDRMRLSGNYTLTDADNPDISAGNTWNTSFGKHDLTVGLDAQITDRLSGLLTVQHVADRQTLPDYTVANATLTYDVNAATQAYLRIENLTDEAYQLQEGYGTSDRAFYIGIRAQF